MNRDTMTWTIIFVIGLALILIRIVTSGVTPLKTIG